MTHDLFRGDLVRLVRVEPEIAMKKMAGWECDSEYKRLMDDDPVHLISEKKLSQKMTEMEEKERDRLFILYINTLADDRLIGFVDLYINAPFHREAWVGIGLGDKAFWGKGYGTDAMRLALRFAFQELNLFRVSLDVFEYNPRAIRSYEKAGFVLEGRARQSICRDGNRYDLLVMGILRDEWFAKKKLSEENVSG